MPASCAAGRWRCCARSRRGGSGRRWAAINPARGWDPARPWSRSPRAAPTTPAPEAEWPHGAPPRPFAGDPRVDAIASLLHGVVRSRAADMELAPGMLGTRGDLEEVARMLLAGELDSGGGVPLLVGWRRAAVGEELLLIL